MALSEDTMREVSMVLDTQQLQAQIRRKLLGCPQPPHEVLLRTCLNDRLRQVA